MKTMTAFVTSKALDESSEMRAVELSKLYCIGLPLQCPYSLHLGGLTRLDRRDQTARTRQLLRGATGVTGDVALVTFESSRLSRLQTSIHGSTYDEANS